MVLVSVPVVVEQRAAAHVPPMGARLPLTQTHSVAQYARHPANAPRIHNVPNALPMDAPLPKTVAKFVFLLANAEIMEKTVKVAVSTRVKRAGHVVPAVLKTTTVTNLHARSAEILQHVWEEKNIRLNLLPSANRHVNLYSVVEKPCGKKGSCTIKM